MKFAQLLRRLMEQGLPEAQDIYNRYKELKKYLKKLKLDPEPAATGMRTMCYRALAAECCFVKNALILILCRWHV